MKIPSGMSENEVLDIIQTIANRMAKKYKFGYYDEDDIRQEAIIIGIDGLERYNGSSPLENFLSCHIKNRLLTLRRDKYVRTNNKPLDEKQEFRRELIQNAKKNIVEPIDISKVDDDTEKNMRINIDILKEVELQETIELINNKLEIHIRLDFLKMLDGVNLPKHRRDKVEKAIIEILEENG